MIKKFYVAFIVVFSTTSVIANTPIIDSLKQQLYTSTEEVDSRIATLESLVSNYISVDQDSALYYSDILKSETATHNKSQCKYFQLIGKIYKEQLNLLLFQEQSHKALQCYEALGNKIATAKARTELGIAYAYQGKIKEASLMFNESRLLFFQEGDSLSAIDCSMHLGSLHMMQNEKALGLEKYSEALEFYENTKNYSQLAKICFNIGTAYNSFEGIAVGNDIQPDKKHLDKALEHFQKGLMYCKEIEDDTKSNSKFLESQLLGSVAKVYTHMEEYDIALGYFAKALNISKKIRNDRSIAEIHYDIAYTKLKLGQNYEALDAIHLATPIFERLYYVDMIVRSKKIEADILIELSQYQKAHDICKECYEISKKTETLDVKKDALKCITKTSNALKIYRDAYIFQQEYIAVNDSIQAIANKQNLTFQKKKNEIEKDNALLLQKNVLTELLLKKERLNSRIYALVSLLSFLGLGLLGFIYVLRGKHTKRIKEKTQEIKNANKELSKLNAEFSLLNKDMEITNQKLNNFTSVAAHDLKSPLRTISTYSQLLTMRNKDKLEDKDKQMLQFVSNSSKQLTEMIDDLLAFSKIDQDLGPAQVVPIADVLDTVRNNLASVIQEEKVRLEISENLYEVKAHKNLLSQLFQNLIANGIKFRKKDDLSVIKIDTVDIGKDTITYSISDNGIGIEKQYFDRIFTIFKRLNGNSTYAGSGIGLATCKSILEYYGHKIWLKSEVGKGTSFFFTLPRA